MWCLKAPGTNANAEILLWILSRLNQSCFSAWALWQFFPSFLPPTDDLSQILNYPKHQQNTSLSAKKQMLASSHLLCSNDVLEWTENGILQNWSFCFPYLFSLSVRMIMEKLHCVLPSCYLMNDNYVVFIHQGTEDVVIKVPVCLFSHSIECMVKCGLLGLDHWCKPGLLLTQGYWNPDLN